MANTSFSRCTRGDWDTLVKLVTSPTVSNAINLSRRLLPDVCQHASIHNHGPPLVLGRAADVAMILHPTEWDLQEIKSKTSCEALSPFTVVPRERPGETSNTEHQSSSLVNVFCPRRERHRLLLTDRQEEREVSRPVQELYSTADVRRHREVSVQLQK